MDVVKSGLSDVEAMRALIEEHAKEDKMLSRSLSYLYENLRDYYVAKEGGEVLGCCGLHISWADLAEVKSLAVKKDQMGKGVGKALLDATLGEAKDLRLTKVFTLTLEPEFFKKHGFQEVEKDTLPMKIWGECIQCPKYPNCDEIALTITP